ncbi:uncharacterized protein LOC135943341 [Cloeon dipterum]|uniref:uncharacterized protein LOC135943341 n=1 Tax=Cloeon dipterum TaxID=197152 RepID=UPI00321FAC26
MYPSAAFALLLSVLFVAQADKADWHKQLAAHRETCITEMKLDKDTLKTFKEIRHFNTLEEFPEIDRCLMKCIIEKEVDQSMDDIDKFMEKRIQFAANMAEKLPSDKQQAFLQSMETCKSLRGANNCDTVILFFLCKKENYHKLKHA